MFIMQRSKVEIFVHMVWATDKRQEFVLPRYERAIYACIHHEAQRLNCDVLALDGMPDHVHLVTKVHSTVSIARLAQAVKGVSSRLANDKLGWVGAFNWQDHYAAFSVSRSHLKRVIRYVQRQKERHARNELWAEWEETEIECDLPD